jgi:conjugative relaxase-like TrwC/TraI family protein
MLLMTPIKDAGRAAEYHTKSDGGYFLQNNGLRRAWVGDAAARLGLSGEPTFEQVNRLLHGLHPMTGGQLTPMLTDDRLAGWDLTARLPKGVTQAIERGDTRILPLFYASGDATMEDVQAFATTRVRVGGRDEDRVTGNIVGLCNEHPDTRPTKEDGMSDWDRHMHYVLANATWDDVEGRWKALKVRDIFELRKYFSHRFDLRMATGLAALGYDIETKYEPDGKGGMRYYSWDIKAAPGCEAGWDSVIAKNSRRTAEIEAKEQAIIAGINGEDAENAPERLSAVARYSLSLETRQKKRQDLTLDDQRAYWDDRLEPGEKRAIAATIDRARRGGKGAAESRAAPAMAYALGHHFERNSVVEYSDVLVTAMEQAMGRATPEDLDREAKRQGVLFDGGTVAARAEVSTQAKWDQEQRIIGFARAGRGKFAPLAAGKADGLADLSEEQKTAVRHVWNSTDRVMLIRGGAGTGKTTMMTPALKHLGVPVALLAPSADASRGQLRKEGFADADTVAAFLGDEARQEKIRGGILWVDEAGLLAVDDLDRLCGVAKAQDARIVLQGDPKQHKAVAAHGNMLTVLEDYAGLPVATLTTIQRQKGDYAQAVAAIRDGKLQEADARLRALGWIVEGQGHDGLVAEYARAIEETKANGERKTVLVVDPTHKDGDQLTEKLRAVLKAKKLVGEEEQPFTRLVPLNWTEAEKSDARRYGGEEVIQFFRNAGRFKAGDRVKARQLLPELAKVKPGHFAVFSEAEVSFAEGDTVRITSNGRDVSGKHRLDNGRIDRIRGFTRGGDLVLANGWVLGKDFGHLKHGLVQTSHATQSKTDDIVLAAMNKASLGAMSAEQGYVTVSRGRERGMIFTDLPRDELLEAMARADKRKSATELLQPRPQAAVEALAESRMRRYMERVRTTYRQIQRKAEAVREQWRQRHQEREWGHAR